MDAHVTAENPSDQRLVYHLTAKGEGVGVPKFIRDLSPYEHEPSQLTASAPVSYGKSYYFAPLEKKYRTGKNVKRDTPEGYWKVDHSKVPIKDECGKKIAERRTLTYHEGGTSKVPKENATEWRMHELTLPEDEWPWENKAESDKFFKIALCVVFKTNRRKSKRKRHSDENSKQSSVPDTEVESSERLNDSSCFFSVPAPRLEDILPFSPQADPWLQCNLNSELTYPLETNAEMSLGPSLNVSTFDGLWLNDFVFHNQ